MADAQTTVAQKCTSSKKRTSSLSQYFTEVGEVSEADYLQHVVCDICKCLVEVWQCEEHKDYHLALELQALPPTPPEPQFNSCRPDNVRCRVAPIEESDAKPVMAPPQCDDRKCDNISSLSQLLATTPAHAVPFSQLLPMLTSASEIRNFLSRCLAPK